MVSPAGPVYQAGTLSGNPLATSAGLATLDAIEGEPGFYDRLETLGATLEQGVLSTAGPGVCHFARVGSMWTLFFTDRAVTDWPSAARADRARYGRFFHEMLARGIALAPSQFEANFISGAHTPEDIAQTVAAIADALVASA